MSEDLIPLWSTWECWNYNPVIIMYTHMAEPSWLSSGRTIRLWRTSQGLVSYSDQSKGWSFLRASSEDNWRIWSFCLKGDLSSGEATHDSVFKRGGIEEKFLCKTFLWGQPTQVCNGTWQNTVPIEEETLHLVTFSRVLWDSGRENPMIKVNYYLHSGSSLMDLPWFVWKFMK